MISNLNNVRVNKTQGINKINEFSTCKFNKNENSSKFIKLPTEQPLHVSLIDFAKNKMFCYKGNSKTKKTLENYELYQNYFEDSMNIYTYLNFYKQFEHLRNLILDKSERIALKNLNPNIEKIKKYEKHKLNSNVSSLAINNNNNFENSFNTRSKIFLNSKLSRFSIENKNEMFKMNNSNRKVYEKE